MRLGLTILFFLLMFSCSIFAQPVTLSGSPSSMDRQSNVAISRGYPYSETGRDIAKLVNEGEWVDAPGNEDYNLNDVSFALIRPSTRNFVERLAKHYHNIFCGEKLDVTSFSRPINRQPKNSHPLSVHPSGMAVDLRVPKNKQCNAFLE
jgi:hypothetical protein